MGGLRSIRLFEKLPAADLQALENAAHERQFGAGQDILREGDPGDGIYVIRSGQVKITCLVGQDPRRAQLAQLDAGDFFGEMAVLDERGRSATVTAGTDTVVLFLPREAVLKTLAGSPTMAVTLMREFSMRMRDMMLQYTRELLQAERLTLVGRFARSIVHDFKNPLNIVGISADMVAMDKTTPEMRRTARDRIRRQVERMSNMISELLEFTRGAAQEVVLAKVDYGAFVSGLIAELAPEVEVKSVKLEFGNPPPGTAVLIDPKRLVHVFHNIINNACDAMDDGGTITLRFREEGDKLITELRDSGPGIPDEMKDRLFEPFATHGKTRGTGLGLSICKRIVEDHKGRIEASNAPEGGAVFSFSLPIARQPGSAA